MFITQCISLILIWTILNFEGRTKTKKLAGGICKGTLDVARERDWSVGLGHGCARVAHCVNARWRNFSHCCSHYVSMTSDLRVLSTEKHWPVRRQHTMYTNKSSQCRGKYIVLHWTSREASLRHSSGWGTWSFSPQYRDLRTRGLGATLGDG